MEIAVHKSRIDDACNVHGVTKIIVLFSRKEYQEAKKQAAIEIRKLIKIGKLRDGQIKKD